MHSIVNDVGSYNKGDTGDQHIEHPLSCGNGHPAIRHEIGEPAEEQLDKWHNDGHKQLEQPIIEQAGGVFIYENLTSVYVGKHPAQEPKRQNHWNRIDSIHE